MKIKDRVLDALRGLGGWRTASEIVKAMHGRHSRDLVIRCLAQMQRDGRIEFEAGFGPRWRATEVPNHV